MRLKVGAVIAVIAIGAITLSGCSKTPEEEQAQYTNYACTDFAKYVQAGMPKDGRSEAVTKVGTFAPYAKSVVKDNYKVLTNSVNANEDQWKLAADVFAKSCIDAGWKVE